MKLSIVSSLYHSSRYIEEFCQRASDSAIKQFGEDFEIILVNDGSPDDSLKIALECQEKFQNLIVIDLSRNFGHHKALMTGMNYASGDLIYVLDSDLEESPEWLEIFHDEMQATNCDVVFGVQEARKGGVIERVTGGFFYKLVNVLAEAELPQSPTVARLMTREYLNTLMTYQEREVYLAGIMYLAGYYQRSLVVTKTGDSETTYTFRKKLAATINSITSLSFKPLEYIFYIGLVIGFLSFTFTLWIVAKVYIGGGALPGWASITASIWIACGLIMSGIGVLGIYISKIFSEVKQRPYTTVKEIYKSKP